MTARTRSLINVVLALAVPAVGMAYLNQPEADDGGLHCTADPAWMACRRCPYRDGCVDWCRSQQTWRRIACVDLPHAGDLPELTIVSVAGARWITFVPNSRRRCA